MGSNGAVTDNQENIFIAVMLKAMLTAKEGKMTVKAQVILGLAVTVVSLSGTAIKVVSEVTRARVSIETIQRDIHDMNKAIESNQKRLDSIERWGYRKFPDYLE